MNTRTRVTTDITDDDFQREVLDGSLRVRGRRATG